MSRGRSHLPASSLVMAVTSDGGRHWQVRTRRVGTGSQDFYPASCPTVTDCVVADTKSLFASADGGSTWAEAYHEVGTSSIGGLSCPTTRLCVATESVLADPSLAVIVGSPGHFTVAPAEQLETLPSGDGPPEVSCPTTTTCFFYSALQADGKLVRSRGSLDS